MIAVPPLVLKTAPKVGAAARSLGGTVKDKVCE